MVTAGTNKGKLGVKDLLTRGILSGALLGIATTFAFQVSIQFGVGATGAILFPVGFVMIVLLGLELVTGNFAVVPLGVLQGKITMADLARNWGWVFAGSLIGALAYAVLFYGTIGAATPVTQRLVEIAQAKTIAYESQGFDGMRMVFFKAILCNWMVTMGVVMGFTSTSTIGKLVAMWLPIMTFFALGFEHSVVNIVGGALFTGLALYFTYGKAPEKAAAPAPVLSRAPILEGAGADGGS
jgi:formate/nitrite transporter FocA (FNT family)